MIGKMTWFLSLQNKAKTTTKGCGSHAPQIFFLKNLLFKHFLRYRLQYRSCPSQEKIPSSTLLQLLPKKIGANSVRLGPSSLMKPKNGDKGKLCLPISLEVPLHCATYPISYILKIVILQPPKKKKKPTLILVSPLSRIN